jgi:hypothetical protein
MVPLIARYASVVIEIATMQQRRPAYRRESSARRSAPNRSRRAPARVWTFGTALLCSKPGEPVRPAKTDHEFKM